MIKSHEVYGVHNKLLAEGNYKGFYYTAISLGSHPCCYICIPSGRPIAVDSINCHYGVTYHKEYLHCSDLIDQSLIDYDEGWWIGWDYAHLYDYIYISELPREPRDYEKTYTSEELEEDCKKAIDSILNPDWWKEVIEDDENLS